MGVLNRTPDSFSDGGNLPSVAAAVEFGLRLAREGAMIVDVGGESTRPGAEPVAEEEEAQRVLPVVRELVSANQAIISVDTSKPAVAREALRAGAHLINDVRGMRDDEMLRVCADAGVPVVLMHMQGEPSTMQRQPDYGDVVAEVHEFLDAGRQRALDAGVPDVIVDPGIGFGKSLAHNLALLRSLGLLVARGEKVLVGASRKGMIAALSGEDRPPPADRDPGSISVHLRAAAAGVALVRAHDVRGHVQALRVWEAIDA